MHVMKLIPTQSAYRLTAEILKQTRLIYIIQAENVLSCFANERTAIANVREYNVQEIFYQHTMCRI